MTLSDKIHGYSIDALDVKEAIKDIKDLCWSDDERAEIDKIVGDKLT